MFKILLLGFYSTFCFWVIVNGETGKSAQNLVSSPKGFIEENELDILDAPFPLPSEVLDSLFSQRLFNTTMNYIVPLFEVTLPLRTEDGNTVHLAMQAFFGLFSAIAWVATVAIPLVLTELRPFGLYKRSNIVNGRNLQNPSKFLEYSLPSSKWSQYFNRKVAKDIGLDWTTCFHKTICQAHENPGKHGVLALPFLTLFPPQNGSTAASTRKASFLGAIHPESCGDKYPCFFDVLDLVHYLNVAFLRSQTKKGK